MYVEVYSYLRSPYKDLFVYDTMVQYDIPPETPPVPEQQHQNARGTRWRVDSRSPSPFRPASQVNTRRSRSSSGSMSWSPSGRRFVRETDGWEVVEGRGGGDDAIRESSSMTEMMPRRGRSDARSSDSRSATDRYGEKGSDRKEEHCRVGGTGDEGLI